MEVPPTFSAPPPPKRTNTLLVVILVILGFCVLCCAGIGFFGYKFSQKMGPMMSCVTHFQFSLIATKEYAAAHGGKMPDAKTWQDEIAPYYGKDKTSDKQIKNVGFFDFGDPSKNLGCAGGVDGAETGIAYNSNLAGKTIDAVRKNTSDTVFFEVASTGRNQAQPYKAPEGNSPQKMMGNPRPWWSVTVGGETNVNGVTSPGQNSMFHQGL